MIVGKDFAWGHLGKTGGDATLMLFLQVFPDLVIDADPATDRRKHLDFHARGPAVMTKRWLALNIRRLPHRVLSVAQHRSRHGIPRREPPTPVPAPEVLAESTTADDQLRLFTQDGRIEINRWIRMERLREDLLSFVELLRPVTSDERDQVLSARTKGAAPYNHRVEDFFTAEHVARLYERNPRWAEVEMEVYGGLYVWGSGEAVTPVPRSRSAINAQALRQLARLRFAANRSSRSRTTARKPTARMRPRRWR